MTNSLNHDLQLRHIISIDLNAFVLLKITASVHAPIHFAHALHVHASTIQMMYKPFCRGCTPISNNIHFSRILSTHCRVIMPCKYFSNDPRVWIKLQDVKLTEALREVHSVESKSTLGLSLPVFYH